MTKHNELEATARAELSKEGVTMEQVLAAMAGTPTPVATKPKAPAALPKRVSEALDRVRTHWNKVVINTARRLTSGEVEGLLNEGKGLTETRLAVSKREKLVKEYFINHINSMPEAKDAPKDAKGNAILAKPGEPFVISAGDMKITQTYVKGQINVDVTDLETLIESGRLTKHQYYALTRKVEHRVFDENKALEAIRKNPALLASIREATTASPPSSTLKFG